MAGPRFVPGPLRSKTLLVEREHEQREPDTTDTSRNPNIDARYLPGRTGRQTGGPRVLGPWPKPPDGAC